MNCAVLQARTRYGPSEIAQQENGHTTFNPTARNFPSIRLREIKYISPKCKKKKKEKEKENKNTNNKIQQQQKKKPAGFNRRPFHWRRRRRRPDWRLPSTRQQNGGTLFG